MLDRAMMEARARQSYERSRVARALWISLPLASIAILAWLLGTDPLVSGSLGAFVVALAFAALYAGRTAGRAVAPGTLAGLVPFALVHVGHALGPVCLPGACTEACMIACGLGGVAAGVIVSRWARHTESPLVSLATSGALATAVGAMGCACIGITGAATVAISLAIVSLPATLVLRAR